MKKTHIIGLIVIAIAVAILVSTGTEASTYVDFSVAENMAKAGDNDQVHVVGKLKKDASGNIQDLVYNPVLDANHLEFMLIDNNGREQKVIYNAPKPQDMGRAEQMVIIGNMDGNVFKCEKILLKCPSKYQDGKVEFKEAKPEKQS
ncbi:MULTISPECIES: cytochrome c maturation protein CcmE [Arcicella]|uniref:Cytochrome c maturation protein CcmE n=1 Tax=Arcicella aquatica TaxID=217141 RepID=A0ABU5QH98_9BACT|nr:MULTISPECIES: cytochrome c maturation protein CcmE [Arcicella]MDR6560738.1 cytochrome c-type biogenesis protein CcmE [Arcicella sp. BE51]MDR6810622.1 cytochrome c-type biogenesis protein CcmE [Arcicella sp. BE140]MDR6821972.1 cytochrome c-type biogenesis protein CcmE [Arcicella sp. BE139]MEA5256418.1 cytochrome c maturation protein CcmE [Arcicella aquatica]